MNVNLRVAFFVSIFALSSIAAEFRGFHCKNETMKIDVREYFVENSNYQDAFDLEIRQKPTGAISIDDVMFFKLTKYTAVVAKTSIGTISFYLKKPHASHITDAANGIIDYEQESETLVMIFAKDKATVLKLTCKVYDFTEDFLEDLQI